MSDKSKLKKNDMVQVVAGKDKKKTGKVLEVIGAKQRVVVEGINIVKKAKRAKSQNEKGGIVSIEAPLSISNVMIICKKCGPTRVSMKTIKDKQVRVCSKCKEAL
jgi:large subunit ribosomal protein L24